ncbi:MAG: VOC family protein [Terracidiphilus sp.]|jgi:catechol 2,3-dioxygenase-like lactoylglutathione lyase family enzyme
MALELQGCCTLLSVFDMPTSIRFYRDVLGFQIVSASDPEPEGHFDWCWLKLNDVALMLNTAYERSRRPPAPDPTRIAAHSDTQIYIGCQDLDAACQYLRATGLDVKGPVVRPFGMKQLFFKDPDGYQMCLQWTA